VPWKMYFIAPPRRLGGHLLRRFISALYVNTKALIKCREICLSRRIIGTLVDLLRHLISAFVVKAYYSTCNQCAFVDVMKGLSRHL
ncbi:hypothetical protein PanWU01x14_360060, partial [Parasponia andersonii]